MSGSKNLALAAALGLGAFIASKVMKRKMNAYDFSRKVVLVTGGSRGLGLVLARQLASEGAKIAICARDKGELERARIELEEITPDVLAIPCDLTDRTQVNRMAHSIREKLGSIDVLINNAGIIQAGPYETMTIEDYEYAMATHFWAPLYTILAVIPQMRKRKEGRIVNISSIGGKISVPHLLPYSASKFALTGLSEGLRSELKKEGIIVTTVCPGLMRTGSAKNVGVKGQHQKEYAVFKILDSLPITSISANTAAKKILNACKHGDAELILTFQAKLATAFHGVFPGVTTNILAGVNKIFPDAGSEGATTSKKGYESESKISNSFLTSGDKKASEENNEN